MLASAALLLVVAGLLAGYGFFHSAPPDKLTITAGRDGSMFQRNAERYKKILARSGVKLNILPSEGSLDNLRRLNDPASHVDIGFVQGGIATAGNIPVDTLVSLGSVFYEPLFVFYRAKAPAQLLADFSGKRLVIGREGSGTHQLALVLLKANGIEPGGSTQLLNMEAEDAARDLLAKKVDGIFLMGDSADVAILRKLLREPDIRLFEFVQADAYARRIVYLNKLLLPRGAIDLGRDLPPEDVALVGPTVELVARQGLHPALSDLLLETAREVHGRATLLQKRGEFPSPAEHEFRISEDAQRYYKSGKTFLYRNMPFWLASLADRTLFAVLPVVVLLIPGLRLLPALYNWRIRSRILRWYGALLALERDIAADPNGERREDLLNRLEGIDKNVSRLKVPVSFADQFYVLREHINFVRGRLLGSAG